MSIVLALMSVLTSPADACAMPHEMIAVAEANKPTPSTLADVFAEIDGIDADAKAKESVKKALENAAAATQPQTVIPEVTTPPMARPST